MYQKHEKLYVGKQTEEILSVFGSKYHETSHKVQYVRNKNIYVHQNRSKTNKDFAISP